MATNFENFVKPEVLAPAGDMERLGAALTFGADAVYAGGTAFGMRASPKNFGEDELKDAVASAHKAGAKFYLTCNTLPRNDEFAKLPAFLEFAEDCGVDAFIIADMGVLQYAKKYAPKTEVHISTQAGIVNYETANFFYNLGAKRVVTARELSIEEIAEIRAKTSPDLDIECFVHGAMCVSFSGRCLLSNYLIGRDANRGECAQPCRWKYNLVEEKRPGRFFPIDEDETGTYILNSQDMCMIEHIPELVSAGITSFKIEGRAKSAYYTAVATNAYRCAVDEFMKNPSKDFKPSPWIVEEMEKMSHRQYCTGFYFNSPHENANVYNEGVYVRNWDVVAIAKGWKDGILTVSQRNKFYSGDVIEVMQKGKPPFSIKADEIFNKDFEPIENAPHPMMDVLIKCPEKIEEGSILRMIRE